MAEKIAEDIATLRNIATPQSTPVDGEEYVGDIPSNGGFTSDEAWQYRESAWKRVDRLLGSAYQAGIDGVPFDMLAARNAVHAALTTPPPASQERGEECPACHRAWTEHRSGYSASNCKMKPPSSAAEPECLDCAYNPGLCDTHDAAEQAKPVAINPVEIDSKLIPDAAEQAKPEPVRDHEAEAWLAAQPKLEQAKPDIVDAVDDPNGECPTCPQSLHVEQAQAGEMREGSVEEVIARLEKIHAPRNSFNDHAICDAVNLLRRLAGGVTVDGAMVERALHASVPGGSEVWCWLPQLDAWKPATIAYEIMRAALVDALGAK